MAEIDNLSLAISAEASSATAALDKLITKLNALSNTMASISVSNLSDLAYDMQSLGSAMNYLKSQDFTKLSKSLNALASVNAAQIETLSTGLQSLSNGVLGLGSVTFDATSLTNLATSLSKLGGVKASSATANLGTLKNDLAQLINGMNSISGLTFDVSSLSNLVSTLSKLGNSSATQAVANLPTLSAQLQNFVRQLNGIGALSFDTGNLTELVSSISLLGRKGASQAAISIPQLTTALMNLMTTLSSAPTVNQNVISMTNALANLASTGASTGTAAKSVSSALTSYSSTASTASKSSFSLASAIGKVYASYWILLRAVSKVKDAIEYASDLTEAQNVVTGTFAQYENVMNDFAETSIQNYGMSELTAKTIGSRFQAMGVAAGYARDEMAEMSVTLTGLAGDMASFYNKDAEDVATALNSVFTGETEPLRKYGVDLTNATVEQWALTQGMNVSMSTMTNYEKIMLRYQYTLAHTTDAQGDFARTAGRLCAA